MNFLGRLLYWFLVGAGKPRSDWMRGLLDAEKAFNDGFSIEEISSYINRKRPSYESSSYIAGALAFTSYASLRKHTHGIYDCSNVPRHVESVNACERKHVHGDK